MFPIVARLSREQGTGNGPQVARNQRNAGTLHRHVRARPDRYADLGLAGASLIPSPAIATTRPSA